MTEHTSERVGWPSLIDRVTEWLPARMRRGAVIVPVVRLSGMIGSVTPLRQGMSLAGLARTLERAFSVKHARAVALVINSPGGSPVQSRQIYLRIRQLASEKKLPVLAFVEDVAASGGYMIACAGDEIFCDPSSILGSIGVVGGSFGMQDLIRKIGVERRLYTAGEHKAMLDPFLPENPDDVARQGDPARDPRHLHRAGQGQPARAAEGRRRYALHRRILGREDCGVAWPCGCDRRSSLDPARSLWRKSADAFDCACERNVVGPVRPQITWRRRTRRDGGREQLA